MSEIRLTPEEMFDEHADCQFENEHNELERAMTKDVFCDIFKESEREITELKMRIIKVEFQENIDDVIKKSTENAQEVIRLTRQNADLKEKVCDLEVKLEEKTKSSNDWCSKAMEKHDQFLAVKSKSTQIAIEFAKWFYINCICENKYDVTMRTMDELFQEFLKQNTK